MTLQTPVQTVRLLVPEAGLKMSQPEKRYRRRVRKALDNSGFGYEVYRGTGIAVRSGEETFYFAYRVEGDMFYVDLVQDISQAPASSKEPKSPRSKKRDLPLGPVNSTPLSPQYAGISPRAYGEQVLGTLISLGKIAEYAEVQAFDPSKYYYGFSIKNLRSHNLEPDQAAKFIIDRLTELNIKFQTMCLIPPDYLAVGPVVQL